MLDPASRRRFLETLEHLHRQGLTLVCATHNMDEASLAQRIIVLSKGKVVADGNPGAIFSRREMLASTSIEPPSSLRLAEKIGEYLNGFHSSALTITELADDVDAYLRKKGRHEQ
jgi:ABC-type multidrug transport system ATPase subunit